jgi:hypothetical protein
MLSCGLENVTKQNTRLLRDFQWYQNRELFFFLGKSERSDFSVWSYQWNLTYLVVPSICGLLASIERQKLRYFSLKENSIWAELLYVREWKVWETCVLWRNICVFPFSSELRTRISRVRLDEFDLLRYCLYSEGLYETTGLSTLWMVAPLSASGGYNNHFIVL